MEKLLLLLFMIIHLVFSLLTTFTKYKFTELAVLFAYLAFLFTFIDDISIFTKITWGFIFVSWSFIQLTKNK